MTGRNILQLIESIAQRLSLAQLVPVPVTRGEGTPLRIRQALAILEERHARGEISDAEYVRQLERLTGR